MSLRREAAEAPAGSRHATERNAEDAGASETTAGALVKYAG